MCKECEAQMRDWQALNTMNEKQSVFEKKGAALLLNQRDLVTFISSCHDRVEESGATGDQINDDAFQE